jgi:GR25 family glycosyltransferase involved in LPS biosynthesis
MNGILEFEEFKAFNRNQINDVIDLFEYSDIYKYANLYDTYAVMACAKSHMYLWKKCIELDEKILILEDDVIFYNEEAKQLFKTFDFDSIEFDIFYLDGKLVDEPYKVQSAYPFHSGCAYIITPRAAQILLNKVEKRGFNRALDWEMIMMRNEGIDSKSFNNIVIVPEAGQSSSIKL